MQEPDPRLTVHFLFFLPSTRGELINEHGQLMHKSENETMRAKEKLRSVVEKNQSFFDCPMTTVLVSVEGNSWLPIVAMRATDPMTRRIITITTEVIRMNGLTKRVENKSIGDDDANFDESIFTR